MADRPDLSSRPSFVTESGIPRRTSIDGRASNPNIFSDDYALESVSSFSGAPSIQESIDLYNHSEITLPHALEYDEEAELAMVAGASSNMRSPSISKQPLPSSLDFHLPRRIPSSVSRLDDGPTRSASNASGYSVIRPHSPYRGPTAPSQPYAMYPQITRASSVASQSTIRPIERPFGSHAAPEHPYGMYQQNTVPEEEDDIANQFPLEISGNGSRYRRSPASGNDMGDIVGVDGHVESLPPYTRYADNTIVKADMGQHDPLVASIMLEELPSSPSSQSGATDSDVQLNTGAARDAGLEARKEGWRERSKRRVCCGLPLWMVLLITGVFVAAATLGGVVGGVVGNRRGEDRALATAVPAATTTIYLDADPTATDASTPPCPTGHFDIPLNQTSEINSCIMDGRKGAAWSCLDLANIGINVNARPHAPPSIVFDDYSDDTASYRYGPQPPDFNSTPFDMLPYKDRDDDELGVAMFFYVMFDKLVILPPDAFRFSARDRRDIFERGYDWDGVPLRIGDSPWFCFWNQTISEFWIFVHQDLNRTASTTVTSSPTSSSTPTVSASSGGYGYGSKYASSSSGAIPTSTSSTASVSGKAKRATPTLYPKMVKMVEKRKGYGNIPPYCQQMSVQKGYQIVPKNKPTMCIEEKEYWPPPSSTATSTGPKRRWEDLDKRDSTVRLESNCICEWRSG